MSDIKSFVTSKFGSDAAAKLGFIRRGGDNNRKGSTFEGYVAVAKVCELATQCPNLAEVFVTSQEEAFVDDLCICRPSEGVKHNYQIKNSDGQAGAWTGDMEWRFEAQKIIDQEYHGVAISQQTLLVACQDRAMLNARAIPDRLKAFCFSDYLLPSNRPTEFLLKNPRVSEHISALCLSDRQDVIDAAFRCMVGVVMTNDSSRSVADVLEDARRISSPDLFRGLDSDEIAVPAELCELCDRFQNLNVHVECGRFFVSYNGMSATVSPRSIFPESLSTAESVFEVMMLLMQVATSEIQDA